MTITTKELSVPSGFTGVARQVKINEEKLEDELRRQIHHEMIAEETEKKAENKKELD